MEANNDFREGILHFIMSFVNNLKLSTENSHSGLLSHSGGSIRWFILFWISGRLGLVRNLPSGSPVTMSNFILLQSSVA
jgi:hypothetical protein